MDAAWAGARHPLVMWAARHRVGLNIYLYIVISEGLLPQQTPGAWSLIRADQTASFQAMQERWH